MIESKLFRSLGDEHHVRTFFEDGARGLDWIFDATKTGDRTGAKRGGVHNDGVAFDIAIEIEMRAVACVEDRIVFEDGDRGFDGVEGVATVGEVWRSQREAREGSRRCRLRWRRRECPRHRRGR